MIAGRPFGDFPAAFIDEPIDEGANRIGKRLLNRYIGDSSVAIRLGHGKHHNRRLFCRIRPKRLELHVRCLQHVAVAGHHGREGGVDCPLDIRPRAKTGP